MTEQEFLRERWLAVTDSLGVPRPAAEPVLTELITLYGAEDRHYHNLNHLAEMLAQVEELASLARDVQAVKLAVFFHDAVYDSRQKDNEARSADLARERLEALGIAQERINEVVRLIMLTTHHQPDAEDANGCVLVDADLETLGAPSDKYLRYNAAIRREYEWVPDQAFQQGRIQVLESFLNRPRIYHTEVLFERLEAQARQNLAQELQMRRERYSPGGA